MARKKKILTVSEMAALGGKARAKKLTKQQREDIARKAGKAGGKGRPKKAGKK